MQVPSDWKHSHRKRKAQAKTDAPPETKKIKEDSKSLEDLGREICREIVGAKEPKDMEELMNFDSVLSTVPYQQILQNLFGGNSEAVLKDIPVITRSYEESFMREPINRNERPCAMGSSCECMKIDPQNQFVGVEFKLPIEEVVGPHMCVLCSRKTTQKLFYDLVYGSAPPVGLIQRYGVMANTIDEYKAEYCLIMPPQGPVQCMPLPSVIHCRNNYTVQTRACIRYVIQKSDLVFQMPLPSIV